MAVEYNPNDFGHPAPGQNPGQIPGQNSVQNPGHGQYPAPGQAAPQPYAPHPAPAPHPQGHPAPYVPQQGQPAPQHPPAYHYPAQQPAPYPGHAPGQAYEQRPAQAYVPAQPGPQFQTPGEAQNMEPEPRKSRFKRGKKAKAAKQPRAKKVKQPSEGKSGGSSLKPFLMGLVTGAVLMFAGLVFMGNQAKKSLQADFDEIAAQVSQMPVAEEVFINEDGTVSEIIVAETPSEQPE